MHAGKSVFILCGKHYILAITRHFISLQRGKNHSHKVLFSYVQTNQSAPYCPLETSSRCAALGRDVYTICWMISQIVPQARFFEHRVPI